MSSQKNIICHMWHNYDLSESTGVDSVNSTARSMREAKINVNETERECHSFKSELNEWQL